MSTAAMTKLCQEFLFASSVKKQFHGCCALAKYLTTESNALAFAHLPGALDHLVLTSRHATTNLQTRLCVVFELLARFKHAATLLIGRPSFLNHLVDLLKSELRPRLRSYAFVIASSLCAHSHLTTQILQHPSMLAAILLAVDSDSDIRPFACDALVRLCAAPESIAAHRSIINAHVSPLLASKDPRVALSAVLCVINTLERNAFISDSKAAQAFSTRSVGSILSVLDASTSQQEYLGMSWPVHVCMHAVHGLSVIHRTQAMLERRETVELLLRILRLFLQCDDDNHDGSTNHRNIIDSTIASLAIETLLNVLTRIPRQYWCLILGIDETIVQHQLVRVREKIRLHCLLPTAIIIDLDSLQTLIDLLAPTSFVSEPTNLLHTFDSLDSMAIATTDIVAPSLNWLLVPACSTSTPPFNSSNVSSNNVIPESLCCTDVLGAIISAENNQLATVLPHLVLEPLTPPTRNRCLKLRPGQKRCPSCSISSAVRVSKCRGCGYCFYLTVSPTGPANPVGRGFKVCPSCGEISASKRAKCSGCEFVFFATRSTRVGKRGSSGRDIKLKPIQPPQQQPSLLSPMSLLTVNT
jgi:hypothetical protein